MNKSDERVFWGLVALAVLLVAAAFFVAFRAYRTINYETADTPRAAFRNFVLAVNRGDYGKAYSLLGDTTCKPSFRDFREMLGGYLTFTDVEIRQVKVNGDKAELKVYLETSWGGPNLFLERSGPGVVGTVELVRTPAGWKITKLPEGLPFPPLGLPPSQCPWHFGAGGD